MQVRGGRDTTDEAVTAPTPAAMAAPRYRGLADGLRADVGRAIAMAAGGALAFAPVEYAIATWAYAGATSAGSKLRLAALTATLALILWLMVAREPIMQSWASGLLCVWVTVITLWSGVEYFVKSGSVLLDKEAK